MRKLLRVMDIITIVTVEIVTWVYTYVKTYQIVLCKYMQFILFKYISMKFNFKKIGIVHHLEAQSYGLTEETPLEGGEGFHLSILC